MREKRKTASCTTHTTSPLFTLQHNDTNRPHKNSCTNTNEYHTHRSHNIIPPSHIFFYHMHCITFSCSLFVFILEKQTNYKKIW